ncbi:MAG: DNA polymerase III subunit alpha [Alphaproteobacteria bacterium]|nr:DNA polymerase III subunit alpha [Alphaproteobacteria bacterium]
MAFAHLHCRTQFSLLDGAVDPKYLAKAAGGLELAACAITDTCNLYGGVGFFGAAKGAGVQPVLGAEIWMWPPGLAHRDARAPDGGWHLVFLVEGEPPPPKGEDADWNPVGYRNLSTLITTAIFDGMHYRPRIDWDLLAAHKDGLIVLTSGLNGPVGRALAAGRPEQAADDLRRLRELFGPDHLFVELQDTGLPGQTEMNALGRQLAGDLGLRTVVTNDVRYLTPQDAVTLDLLNAIGRGENLDAPDREPVPTDQQYLKSEAEMRALFPDDGDALDITVEIAARCRFGFKTDTYWFPATTPPDPDPDPPAGPDGAVVKGSQAPRADTQANWEYFYRAFPPPADYGLPSPDQGIPPKPDGAGSINGYFEWYGNKGLELRLQDVPEERHAEYHARMRFEFDIVEDMGFPAYLLIVAEFINWAKDNEIPVGPGRGSGAGSLVNFAMRITDIDPLRFGLLMERFLNPERVSMPDIDVDFCQDRREEVIEHTRKKYGEELVSQIITYGKLQAKAALKDVARVLGINFRAADAIAKLVPNELGIKLDAALEEERLKTLVEGDPQVGRVYALARRVEGMVRQTGVHAAGVVIADRPIVAHAPLYRDGPEGGPVVQYEMKSAEGIGLIKFDFLGLKTLDQIRDAVAMIARNTGEQLDMARLPLDDGDTFTLLQKGDALGVFQVESSGMRDLLTRLRPSNIDDLIALLALYRPGPLSSGMVDNFIDCKHGRKEIEYPHPSLQPILESTYGSIVYQEQVMQIAQVYAGYSLGGADLLRRAMGKKKPEEMDKQRTIFVEGAKDNGHPEQAAHDLFDLLAFFAGYGFNKSHSAAYGVVSYFTAWLKAHHRAEYMAALMTIEAGNTDKVVAYIGDCKRAGLKVLPPDVNHSVRGFDVPADARDVIRFGMAAVKGVGDSAIEAILEARADAGGSFTDLMDCLDRLDYRRVNKKVLESLIKCGAFDWTGHPRRAMLEGLAGAVSVAQGLQEQRAAGQMGLFGGLSAASAPKRIQLPDVGDWPTAVKLSKEREALGFFITGHPLQAYRGLVERMVTCSIPDLDRMPADREVTIAGMVTTFRQIVTKKGSKMAFATLEDEHGSLELVFFPEPYLHSSRALASEAPLLVRGKLEKTGEGSKILAESAEVLSDVRIRRTRALHIRVDEHELPMDRLPQLEGVLRESEGRIPVTLHLRTPGHARTTVKLAPTVVPDEALMQGLESLFRRADAVELR